MSGSGDKPVRADGASRMATPNATFTEASSLLKRLSSQSYMSGQSELEDLNDSAKQTI